MSDNKIKVSEKDVQKVLERVRCDDRKKLPPANVEVNAPLALIQVYLDTVEACMKWVLGLREDL